MGDPSLDQLLLCQVECGNDFVAAFLGRQHLLNKVRGEKSPFTSCACAEQACRELRVDFLTVVPIALG